MNKKNTLLIAARIVVAGIVVAVALIYSLGNRQSTIDDQQPGTEDQKLNIDLSSAPILGEANAPVTLVEFGDFQCPACNVFFQQIEPQLRERYIETGKVKMVFKTLTFIDSFDGYLEPNESFLAGAAGECSKEQGKFWPMHDAIFGVEKLEINAGKNAENNGNLSKAFFLETAKSLNLDIAAFTSCLDDSQKHKDQFAKNMSEAEKLMSKGVSTPTVFINGEMIQGVTQFSEYEKVMEKYLK